MKSMNLLEHFYFFVGFYINWAWCVSHSYHAMTLSPCTGMLMVFTVSSFLFFSVSVAS